MKEKIAELKEELATNEALLGRCFPNVFDGTLEWGAYDEKKEEYGEIIEAVVDELVEPFLTILKEEIKKSLLTDEEIKQIGRTSCDGSMIGIVKTVAQAQLDNSLKALEEKLIELSKEFPPEDLPC